MCQDNELDANLHVMSYGSVYVYAYVYVHVHVLHVRVKCARPRRRGLDGLLHLDVS